MKSFTIYLTVSIVMLYSFAIEIKISMAITDTLFSIGDNTLYEDLSGQTSNGAGNYFFAGTTSAGSKRRGIIKFATDTKIPPGAVITGVTLRLSMSRSISASETVNLYKVLFDWGEGASLATGNEGNGAQALPGDATWLNTIYPGGNWENRGGDFSETISASTPVNGIGFYSWSSSQMINDVQDWISNPGTDYGWILVGNEESNGNTKRFDTKENSLPGNRPVLIIQYNFNKLGLRFDGIAEGFRTATGVSVKDTMKVFIRNSSSPYSIVDNAKVYKGINGAVTFFTAGPGNYFLQVTHRNSISTWSSVSLSYPALGTIKNYLFTTCACQALGSNMVQVYGKYCFYGGDTNRDGIVDASDYSDIDNAANEFISGYVSEDLTGDEIVDGTDASICENNASNFISEITP